LNTVIIGGGKGCRNILKMIVGGRLKTLNPVIKAVVDSNDDAPGVVYAKKLGFEIMPGMEGIHFITNLQLIIELTGKDEVLSEIYKIIPPGVRLLDHTMARVFWDIDMAEQKLRKEFKEKVKLEQQLKKDRRQLQEILNSVPDIVLVLDINKKIELVNEPFCRLTGITLEEARGISCYDVFCKKTFEGYGEDICPFDNTIKTKRSTVLIQSRKGKDNKEKFFEITISPILDEQGNIIRVVETSHPITDLVTLTREMQESEEMFRMFINTARDLISIKNLKGEYLLVNPQTAHFFKLKPDDFTGKRPIDILPPNAAKLISAHDDEVIKNPKACSFNEEFEIDGEEFFLNSTRFPLYDFKGDMVGLCVIARDVTEQIHLQHQMINTERLAAMGKLAAGVAHELNNPLTGILTFSQDLMESADVDDPNIGDYKLIYDECMRCRQIVRDLLDFARLQKPNRIAVVPAQVIKKAISLIVNQAIFHNIKFKIDIKDSLPEIMIDPNQIQQVILNLVINAAHAMDYSGTIEIAGKYLLRENSIEFSIRDYGCGISEENLKKIFEPFFTTKGRKGNGLGLPAVQTIIDQHSGQLSVDSKVNEGTVFFIKFPVSNIKKGGDIV